MARAVLSSYLVAALLAAITLTVFWVLQDYGPESAVRRFQDDLASKNFKDLQQVSEQPIDSPPVLLLARNVLRLYGQTRPQIGATDRSPDQVYVLALYQLPDGVVPIVWIVRRDNGFWKVDAKATVEATDALGGNH